VEVGAGVGGGGVGVEVWVGVPVEVRVVVGVGEGGGDVRVGGSTVAVSETGVFILVGDGGEKDSTDEIAG
jgi:hypothetical protein